MHFHAVALDGTWCKELLDAEVFHSPGTRAEQHHLARTCNHLHNRPAILSNKLHESRSYPMPPDVSFTAQLNSSAVRGDRAMLA